jgi:hypothetical protein
MVQVNLRLGDNAAEVLPVRLEDWFRPESPFFED